MKVLAFFLRLLYLLLYRTNGVIIFLDYCTLYSSPRHRESWKEKKEKSN
jgi:hypothetical protein